MERLPFSDKCTLLARSANSNIYSYPNNELVRKTPSNETNAFPNIACALVAAAQHRQEIADISACLPGVVNEDCVIHQKPDGSITFSRIQKNIDGSTLADINLLKLEMLTFKKLKCVADSHVAIWRKEKILQDFGGSHVDHKKFSLCRRIIRAAFPIFYSTNVMVDTTGNIKTIDIGNLREHNMPMHKFYLRVFGLYTSALCLNTLITLKKLKYQQGVESYRYDIFEQNLQTQNVAREKVK